MNLFVFNSEEQLLAVLDERHVVEAIHTEQLNNIHSLEFTVLANSDHAFGIMEGNLVAFCDQEDNEFQLFEIAIIEDNHGDVALKTAICEHAINELLDEYVKRAVFEKASADKVLDYLLSSTRWQKGEVSALGEASFKIESSNAKSALNEVLNTWHGEVKYRISISGNKIAGRYIDILSRRGNDTGKRFEYDKDVKEIERTVDMTGVKTAIRGYGQPKDNEKGDSGEPLTFKDVVWKKENGDPVDKPKGQDWVGDEHARLIWGRTDQNGKRHRYGIYEQSDEKDAEKLLQQTFEYLESTSSPLVNYAGKVIDLFRLSLYEHERVHLGDTVAVLDDDVYPKIQERTRIIEIKRDLLDPTNDEIVLGEFLPLFSDPNQELQRVVAKVKENAHVWDKAGRPINPGSFPDTPPKTPGNVMATGLFSAVMVEWDYNYLNTYVAGYEVYASEVEGFAGTPETLVYRGRANGYVFQGEANKQYYFRVRAFNYHETYSAFSEEISATTARIVSDDILFGEDIAEELRRLSERAQIIADGSLGVDQIKQDVFDQIERDTRRYTDKEIQHVENHINQELADKAGFNYVDGKFTNAVEVINGVESDIRKDLADKAGIDYVDGKFVAADDQIKAINDGISTINTELNVLDEGLSLRIDGVAGELDNKLNTGTFTDRMTSIDASIKGINTKVSDHTTDINTVTGEVSGVKSRTSTLEQRADAFSVNLTSLETTFGNMKIGGGRNLILNSQSVALTGTDNGNVTTRTFADGVGKIQVNSVATWNAFAIVESALAQREFLTNAGQEYVLSVDVLTKRKNTGIFRFDIRNVNAERHHSSDTIVPNSQGKWVRISTVVTIPNDGASRNRILVSFRSISANSAVVGDVIEYRNFKLESGNKHTDWTPAPEETKTEIDGLKERTTKTETDLSVLPGLISAKASQGQVDRIESNKLDTTVYNRKMSELAVDLNGIRGNVSSASTKVDTLTGDVTSLTDRTGALELSATGFNTKITSLESGLGGIENRTSAAETAINQKADALELRAVKTDVDSIAGRLTTAEGEISVQAGEISQKVSRDGIISSINLTPEQIKIDTRLLNVGDFTNLADNSDFEDDRPETTPLGWFPGSSQIRVQDMRSWTNGNGSNQSMRVEPRASGNVDIYQERYIKVAPGEQLYIEAETRMLNTNGNRRPTIGFRTFDAKKAALGHPVVASSTSLNTSWVTLSGNFTVPANVAYVRVWLSWNNPAGANNSMYYDNIIVRRRANAQLIVDGAITANKMAAGSITAGNAAIANAAITRANLQEAIITNAHIAEATIQSAKLANVSADKINTGTLRSINLTAVTITGSTITSTNGNNTTTIRGGYFESSGRYRRDWRGSSRTYQVDMRFENGLLRARNNTEGWSLYFTDTGISTYADGIGNNDASGTIAFRDTYYSASNARGVTMHSTFGTVALRSDNNRIVIDANQTVNLESDTASIYIRPMIRTRSGSNEFAFRVKNNSSPSDTDGWISYGSANLDSHASGLRFKKTTVGDPIVYVTNGNGDFGTGKLNAEAVQAALEANPNSQNAYVLTDNALRVVSRLGYNNGNMTWRVVEARDYIGNSIRLNLDAGTNNDFYIGCSSREVRVTNNLFWNGGNTGYRPIRASSFIAASSRQFKTNINPFKDEVLPKVRQMEIQTYHMKADIEQGMDDPPLVIGLISEDNPYVNTEDRLGIDTSKLNYVTLKAVQELDSKLEDTIDEVSFLKLENQLLKRKINELEERIA